MTTQELIDTYQLNFFNKVQKIGNSPAFVSKIPGSINLELTNFLICWDNPNHINGSLIHDIEEVLNGIVLLNESDSPTVWIDITIDETKFYKETSSSPDYVLPTQDFYDIVLLWRDFLLEPPLDGTKVDENGNIVS